MKIQVNNSKVRCPHCNGFLYSAALTNRRYFHTLRDKVACINCARMWRLANGAMVVWPERNENAVVEDEPTKAKTKSTRSNTYEGAVGLPKKTSRRRL